MVHRRSHRGYPRREAVKPYRGLGGGLWVLDVEFAVTVMEATRDVELLRSRLSCLTEPCIKAVVMFGFRARGESRERSDLDLLIST